MPDRSLVHVVVTGPMGAGKSTVGRPLAASLELPFVDNDALLRAATDATPAELATRDGIDALHEWERRLALEAVARATPSVIAVAASLGAAPEALTRMRERAWIVWLHAAPEVLRARTAAPSGRPDVGARVAAEAGARAAAYRQAADLTVDTGTTTPAQSVDRILAALPGALRRDHAPRRHDHPSG